MDHAANAAKENSPFRPSSIFNRAARFFTIIVAALDTSSKRGHCLIQSLAVSQAKEL